MENLFREIKAVCDTAAVGKNTKAAFEYIKNTLSPFCNSVTRDNMGNIIAFKKNTDRKNNAKKLVLEANIDQPGFVVTYTDEKRATLHGIGKRAFSDLSEKAAASSGGIAGKLVTDAEEPKSSDYFFVTQADDTKKVLQGDTVIPSRTPSLEEDRITLDGMGAAALCGCLIDIAKKELSLAFDLYFVFSSEKHTANRGALAAASAILPDKAVVLELVPKGEANDHGGAVILAKTNGALLSPRMTKELAEASAVAGTKSYISAHTPENDVSSAVHFISEGAICGAIAVECDDFDNKGIINTGDIMALEATICAFLIIEDEHIGKEE